MPSSLRSSPCGTPCSAGVVLLLAATTIAEDRPSPPRTQAREVRETIHGVEVADPYRWLEDQESPETRAWIEAQTRYTRSVLDSLPARDAVERELGGLYRVDSTWWVLVRNGRFFYHARAANEQRLSIRVRTGPDGPERVLVDPATVSASPSANLWLMDVSRDGTRLLYGIKQGGEDEMELAVLDVESGRHLDDRLPRAVYYEAFLLPDNTGFYYNRRDRAGTRLLHHRMGTDPARDRVVFGEGYGDETLVWLRGSADGRYVGAFVAQGAGTTPRMEVFVEDRAAGGGFRPIVTGIDAPFWGQFVGDQLYLRTTWQAPTWRILAIDLRDPAREKWREVVAPAAGTLEDFGVARNRLVLTYGENVNTRLRVVDLSGRPVGEIPLPTLGSAWLEFASPERPEILWGFSSLVHARTIYRRDLETGEQSVWFQQRAPSGLESIETRQVWYASRDGTRVPMFVVAPKGVALDGSRPTLLTAYGGYGASMMPYYDPDTALWVRRGGVFALANIRGGGEFGEPWHRAGMLENKQNSFDDFLAAAEWLVANGYTRPSRLAIRGMSNGGLLVGAALTQRPELFQAVVCEYPHLDMIRFHKFLQAAPWVAEYGSPDDPRQFAYLYAYSPYHRVEDGTKYPATLLVTGDADTRVAPLHARKMTARLQAATASDRPVLLRYSTTGGHFLGQTLDEEIDEAADRTTFLLWQLGALPASPPQTGAAP